MDEAHSRSERFYSPASQLREPRQLCRNMLHDLGASRELAWRLMVRNVSARYRQTILRYAWAVLPPLLTTLVFVFLKNTGHFTVAETPVPYALFVLSGMTFWQLFTDALSAPMRMVGQSASMLTKVNFPREALILAGIGEVFFSFLIRLALLVAAMIWFRISAPWTIALVLVGVLALVTLGIAIGLLLTPLAVLYQDIGQGMPFITSLWMFLTPVLYPANDSGPGFMTFAINPVSPLLDTTRAWLLTGSPQLISGFVVVSGAALIVLIGGWLLYRLAMPILIERMTA